MKERAVTMDADAVRATLAGLKTQMRVPVKLRGFGPSDTCGYDWTFRDRRGLWNDFTTAQLLSSKFCPVHVGDRLRVRETWCPAHPDSYDAGPDVAKGRPLGPTLGCGLRQFAWYAATDPDVERSDGSNRSPWLSPFTMPRWASRLTLEVSEVRLQRLQEIAEEDAIAEGVRHWPDIPDSHPYGQGGRWSCRTPTSTEQCFATARYAFASHWCRITGKSWDGNPWVWAYTYRRVS